MEQPVAHCSPELVQLGSGGVDQLGPGPAQRGPVDPEWQSGGQGGSEGAGQAEDPRHGEEELLLSARHVCGGTGGGTEGASPPGCRLHLGGGGRRGPKMG